MPMASLRDKLRGHGSARATFYRARADEARMRAEGFVFAEWRSSLLQLAEIYDLQAASAEEMSPEGSGGNLGCF